MRVEDGDEFVETLLEWYVENGRHDLPWRDQDASPFEILVARRCSTTSLANRPSVGDAVDRTQEHSLQFIVQLRGL